MADIYLFILFVEKNVGCLIFEVKNGRGDPSGQVSPMSCRAEGLVDILVFCLSMSKP